MPDKQPSQLKQSLPADNSDQFSLADIEQLFSPAHIDRPSESIFKSTAVQVLSLARDHRHIITEIAQNQNLATLKKVFLTTLLASMLTIANCSATHPGHPILKYQAKSPKVYTRQKHLPPNQKIQLEHKQTLSTKLNSCQDISSVYKLVKNLKNKNGDSPTISLTMDASSYYKGNDYFDKNGHPVEYVATGKTFERGIDVAVDPDKIAYGSIVYVEYYDYRNVKILDPVVKTKKIPGQNFTTPQNYIRYILQNTKDKLNIEINGAKVFLNGRLASDTGDPDFIAEDYDNDGTKRSLDISVGDNSAQGQKISDQFGIVPYNCLPDDQDFFKLRIAGILSQKYKIEIPANRIDVALHHDMKVVIIPPDTFDDATKKSILNHTLSQKEKIEADILLHSRLE